MREELIKRATKAAADLRGEQVHTNAIPITPPVSNLVDLSEVGANALGESRRLAKALTEQLPGFVERTRRFVSSDGVTVLSKAGDVIDELVAALSLVYVGEAAPSGLDDLPPQARTVSGGAALSKALVEQLEQLTDPALPDDIRKTITKAADELGGLVDLAGGLTDLDGDRSDLAKSEVLVDTPSSRRGPRRAVLQLHAIGKSIHADLRLEQSADHLVGWRLDLAPTLTVDSLEQLEKAASTWSPDGSRGFCPLAGSTVKASPKGRHSAAWLTVKAEASEPGEIGASAVEPGFVVTVDEPTLELGLQDEDRHEYFLAKGELAGRLIVEELDGTWSAKLEKTELIPDVLTREAVLEKRMPPDGTSGIPESVEKCIPHELRFWTHKGDDARAIRDELVEKSIATKAVIIDQEIRLVEPTLRLIDPIDGTVAQVVKADVDGNAPPPILKKLERLIPEGTKRIVIVGKVESTERLAKSLSGQVGEVILYDLDDGPSLERAVDVLTKSDSDYLVGAPDTDRVRELLSEIGQPFGFPLTLEKRLYAASFPVPSTVQGVEWIAKAKWTTAFVNDLPDSAFLWIGSGGKKDSEGKTTPRSLRKLPIRDDKGKLDLPHLRNAIARIPQTDGPSAAEKKKLQARARRLLEQATKSSTTKTIEILERTRLIRPMLKADEDETEERFTLGIVLEPDIVDAQKDTYDVATIRAAAHGFMEEFQALGIQHKEFAADKMVLLESYLTPVDFDIETSDGETISIKEGTWLMGIRFVDDKLWQKVKDGDITGLSIGGSAVRTPEPTRSDDESTT